MLIFQILTMSFLDTNLKINGLLYRKKEKKISESYELFWKIMSEMARKIIPALIRVHTVCKIHKFLHNPLIHVLFYEYWGIPL